MTPNYPSVALVIPTWNGLALLKQSLDSFVRAANSYQGQTEIVVVDNGSLDRTVDVLKDYYPNVKVIEMGYNTGFGHACNVGAMSTECDLVFFLNNDIFISDSSIDILVKSFQEVENCFSVSPQTNYWRDSELTSDVFSSSIQLYLNDNGELIQNWAVHNLKNLAGEQEPTMYGTGAALLVDRQKFLVLGGFDNIYGLAYWEDVDVCLKAWQRNWPSYYTSKVIAWHKLSASSNKSSNSGFKQRQVALNYILFQLIHIPNLKLLMKFSLLIIRSRKNLATKRNIFLSEIIKRLPLVLKRRMKNSASRVKSFQEIATLIKTHEQGYKTRPLIEGEIQ